MSGEFRPPTRVEVALRKHLLAVQTPWVQEYGRAQIGQLVEAIKRSPVMAEEAISLNWIKFDTGEYRAQYGEGDRAFEIRCVAVSVDFRRRPDWTIETRQVVSQSHVQQYGPAVWHPSWRIFSTMRDARTWAAHQLTQEAATGNCPIHPDGSRGHSSLQEAR